MDASLKSLLEELYAADPSLRAHEADVVALIEKMRTAHIAVHPDADFVQRLRVSVLEHIATPAPKPVWTKMVLWAAPVAAVAIVAFLVRPSTKLHTLPSNEHGITIATAGDSAFGALGVTATKTTAGAGRSTSLAPAVNEAVGTADTQASPMVLQPNYVATTFAAPSTYSLPSLPVLRRDPSLEGMGSVLSSLSLSQIQIASFTNVAVDYLTLSEQKNNGYSITVDRKNGQVSLYKNYSGDVVATKEFATNSTSDTTTLPPDGTIISAANQFLQEHGISRQGLAEPIVRKDWQVYKLMLNSSSTSAYVPSDVTVVYPWVLSGTPVVDDSGQPYGLMVTVHVGDVSVTSVSNIVPMNFTASKYNLVSTATELSDVIKRGGLYGYVPDGATSTTVQLGEPTVVYIVSRYQLNADDADVLVPALSFPVPAASIGTVGRSYVVVPLVKELLDQSQKSIPYATPATGSGSAPLPVDLVVPETAPVNK